MSKWHAAALAVGAAACAPSAELRRVELAGTVWREVCPNPAIVTATVELRLDGLLGWSYSEPSAIAAEGFRLDTLHTWAVADGALDIRWNLGSARSRYRPTADPGVMRADSSTFCLAGPTLHRFDTAPATVNAQSPSARTNRSPRTVTDGTTIHGESERTGDGL